MSVKFTKDANGTFVGSNTVITGFTQADLDAQATLARAISVSPEQAYKITQNAAVGAPMSTGTLAALSKVGIDVGSKVGNNIATIDAMTRETRTANQRDLAAQQSTLEFNNSLKGQGWSVVKGLVRNAALAGMTLVDSIGAGYRSQQAYTQRLFENLKSGNLGGVLGAGEKEAIANEPSIISQTTIGQVAINAFKNKTLSVELGNGFFPDEQSGAAHLAREASLKAGKIAIKDGMFGGKVVAYRPRTLQGDFFSNVFTFGNPEGKAGAVISAFADLGVYMTVGNGARIRNAKKIAAQLRATGAIDAVAKTEEFIKIEEEARAEAIKARDAFVKHSDEAHQANYDRAVQNAKDASLGVLDKNQEAVKASIGVRTMQAHLDEVTTYVSDFQTQVNDAKQVVADIAATAKAPKNIIKIENQLNKAIVELKDLRAGRKAATASGSIPMATVEDIAKAKTVVAELTKKLDETKSLAAKGTATSEDALQVAQNTLDKANARLAQGKDFARAAKIELANRTRIARMALKIQERASTAEAKNIQKTQILSSILKDSTLSREAKLKAYSDALEKTAGIRDARGNTDFQYDQIANFLTGGHGDAALKRLTDMTDWKQIWRQSKGKIDSELAQVLANAKTKTEVLDAIAPFIKRGELRGGLLKPSNINLNNERVSRLVEMTAETVEKLFPGVKNLTGVGARVQSRLTNHTKVAGVFNALETGAKTTIKVSRAIASAVDRQYNTIIRGGHVVNLHDTEELLHSVNDFGIAVKLPRATIDKLMDEITSTTSASVRGYTASVGLMKEVFALYKDKIPKRLQESFKDSTRAFESSQDEMASYWASRHSDGAFLKFVSANGKITELPGPHLDSELLNSIAYLPSPADILRLTSWTGKYAVTSWGMKVGDVLIGNFWKKMQLVRPAFIIRNIAEEQLRVFGSGHMSFFNHPIAAIAMWLGRENGGPLRQLLARLDDYKHNIFDESFTTGDEVADLINETAAHGMKNSYVDLMSSNTAGSFDERAIKVLTLDGSAGTMTSGNTRFFEGVANEIRKLHGNEMSRVVAGYDFPEIAQAVAKGAKRDDAVVDYYFSGAGRKALIAFSDSAPQETRDWLRTRNGLKEYLYTGKTKDGKDISILARVMEAAGGNRSLREMIAKGTTKVGDKTLSLPSIKASAINSISNAKQVAKGKKALLDANEQLADEIKKTFKDAGNWDGVLMKAPTRKVGFDGRLEKGRFTQWFFDTATAFEKNSTFGPEFRQAYWDAIHEVAGGLDAKAVAELKLMADKSVRPLMFRGLNVGEKNPVLKALVNAKGNGTLTREEAHIYADNVARMHVKELFYNAHNKRLMFHQLRLIAPFINAWEDTIKSWTKIGIENPTMVYQGIKALNWLQKPESSALYEFTDAHDYYDPNQGFFFNDPNTQQKMFWVPFAGTVMSKLASGLTGNNYKGQPIAFASNPMSFNFALGAGSILPGIGPGITIPISLLSTFNQSFFDNMPQGIKNWMFPFGRSDFSNSLLSAVIPGNWNKILSGMEGNQATYANTFKPVMNYLASGANYNIDDPEDQAKLIHSTDLFARWFSVMRGVVGLFSPSSLQVQALASDKNGDVTTQIALYNDFQQILVDNDLDYNKSVFDFLNLYGATQAFAIISASTGNGPSNWDSYKLVSANPDIVTKYSDVWGLIAPGGGTSVEMYKWNLVNGSKKVLNPKEILQKVNNLRYYAARDSLLSQVSAGTMSKDQYQEANKFIKASMGGGPTGYSDFNKFSRVIFQLNNLSSDKRFQDMQAVAGLRDYMALRNKALSQLGKGATDKLAGSSPQVIAQRAWLSEQAIWIIQDNPDFQKIFYDIFANELEGK